MKDWREHAVRAGLTLMPLALAGAIAWGVMTARTTAMADDLHGVIGRVDRIDERQQASERTAAAVVQRLDDIKERQTEMNTKLDRITAR